MAEFPFKVFSPSGQDSFLYTSQRPDTCPFCHMGIVPQYVAGRIQKVQHREEGHADYCQIVFQCPREECLRLFVGIYLNTRLVEVEPVKPAPFLQPSSVSEVSTEFVEIYNETAAAEQYGLKKIAGPGYRKALEFLVKDYVVSLDNTQKEEVERMALQQVIQEKISNPELKQCAERAAWLGNDETHYLRIWEDRDIEDLKNLIMVAVNWVDSSIRTRQYVEEMPKKKRKR